MPNQQALANAVAGPLTTGQVTLAGANPYFRAMIFKASTAASVEVRAGSTTGPLVGYAAVAAAGVGTWSGPNVKCQGGVFLVITGTVTESSVLCE